MKIYRKEGIAMQELLKKYRARMVKEGLLRSFLYAGVFAFAALAVCAVVLWAFGSEMVWLCAVVFAAVLLIAAPIIFFAFYRPTETSVARRIDKDLGLDERMVTMLELRGNNDIIVCAQRANAVSALRAAGQKGVKKVAITVGSVALIVGVSVSAAIGAGMTTVSALSASGIIPSGKALLSGSYIPNVYTVTYTVDGAGSLVGDFNAMFDAENIIGYEIVRTEAGVPLSVITEYGTVVLDQSHPDTEAAFGEINYVFNSETGLPLEIAKGDNELLFNEKGDVVSVSQTVAEGGNAYAVEAVAGIDEENGETYFSGWSDGLRDPYRADEDISSDLVFTAEFLPVGLEDDSIESDRPGALPGIDLDGDSNNNLPGGGGSMPGDNDDKENDTESEPNPAFQVIDGETDYGGSVYENAHDQAEEEMSDNSNLSDDIIDIIGSYWDIIKR